MGGMLSTALNHMTTPGLRFDALIELAQSLGCAGVEFRNDLPEELFDGVSSEKVRGLAEGAGLRIFALAEVKSFNDVSDRMLADARALVEIARDIGADGVALIPRNDGHRLDATPSRDDLRLALRELAPLLAEFGLVGFVEPLGFETCPLRDKEMVIDNIIAVSSETRFKIVHDTFHHHLADGGPVFAAHTAMVHISGVTAPIAPAQMTDADRGLVEAGDVLGNIDQLTALIDDGYAGPVSVEAFSPHVHKLSDPKAALSRSFTFIEQCLVGKAA